jgi:uncharacterized protein YjbJ (UPF0337 family)
MNKETVSGKFDQVTGKIKQSVGEAVGNEKLANEGAVEQVKGVAKETWGRIKDTANDVADSKQAEAKGHDIREKITSTAQQVKENITGKLDEIKHKHQQ